MPDLSHTVLYRAVEGAVRNALDGHPDWKVPPSFARSVAKRAAGTLAAHAGPSLLASARRSGQRRRVSSDAASRPITNGVLGTSGGTKGGALIRGASPYSFTVEVSGAITKNPQYEDIIYDAGCNDGLVTLVDGKMLIDFDRYAASYHSAVESATAALKGVGATVVSVSPIID